MKLPVFKNQSLLHRALTHRSYLNEHPEALEDNERLEFLGDAVLDFISGAFVFSNFPELREGGLTRLRSALVRTEQLAVLANQMDLGSQVRLGRGEAEAGSRQRQALLCATFEAVLGAYYLDAGVEAVRAYVEPWLRETATEIVRRELDKDAKSLFQEWAQEHLGPTPRYYVVGTSGPEHNKAFTVEVRVGGAVYGVGQGQSKHAAELAAAEAALQRAEQDPSEQS